MDKPDYVQRAPDYYALGIAIALHRGLVGYATLRQLSNSLTDNSRPHLFEKEGLANKATTLLQEAGVIDILKDDFGPTLYTATDTLAAWINSASHAPFVKFHASGQSVPWVVEAVEAVNQQYSQYYFQEGDFGSSQGEQQWEPLPLDRSDPLLQAAQEAVDTAIGQIEGDNGYAVNAPGERAYVLSSLKAFGKSLRDDVQITAMYVKTFALEPLAYAINRFGQAAAGVAAAAARAALIDWLKTNIPKLFLD